MTEYTQDLKTKTPKTTNPRPPSTLPPGQEPSPPVWWPGVGRCVRGGVRGWGKTGTGQARLRGPSWPNKRLHLTPGSPVGVG